MLWTPSWTLLGTACLWLSLSSCNFIPTLWGKLPTSDPSASSATVGANSKTILWTGQFSNSNWMATWNLQHGGDWGQQNMSVIPDPSRRFSSVLRVRYPAGSVSPSYSRRKNAPLGGSQFYANLGIPPRDALRLSYYVRFSDNFDFVKGGKLPGLFGGNGNSGGNIPNGTDGFSTRFMWRANGDGEVYAYLPTSHNYGTSLGRGAWRFQRSVWHHIEQEVILNHPNAQDGRVRVWFDGRQVLAEDGLTFRTVNTLKIDGLFFSTFFGGNDSSWATPRDVYADFANFSASTVNTP